MRRPDLWSEIIIANEQTGKQTDVLYERTCIITPLVSLDFSMHKQKCLSNSLSFVINSIDFNCVIFASL